jgi:hypothetical protein
VKGQFEYVTNSDGASITITGYSGPSAVSIPSNINGLLVTDIGERAFAGTSVANLTIPDSVTNIGLEAFDGCQDLTNVVLNDSLTTVGEDAFAGAGLTGITIPISVTNIGFGAFDVGETLTNVTFGVGFSSIQSSMFPGCGFLNLVIPSTVTTIGEYAFSDCADMTNIFFAGDAPSVGPTAFTLTRPPEEPGDHFYYIATAYYLPGTTNWDEFMSETFLDSNVWHNPTNISLPLVLWNPKIKATGTNFGVQNGQYCFDITAATNLPIAIEACDDLSSSNWVTLQRVTITNGLFHFSEPFHSNSSARFYRIGFP